jgi:D-cysteine desulfhydrase family pyridoxal phosphate-dependent enzyme
MQRPVSVTPEGGKPAVRKVKYMSEKALRKRLEAFPRIRIADLPTPLEEARSLSALLGGPRVFIKRDDQTGLAMGGNKGRKLDFIMADVLKKKADVVVTWAGVQSNWCRSVAAASRKLGLKPILVLSKRPGLPSEYDGNLLLDFLLDADIRIIEGKEGKAPTAEEVTATLNGILDEEKSKGRNPYLAPIGGSEVGGSMMEPLGALSYVDAFLEITEQAESRGIKVSSIVHASGSGSTQAGLAVAAKALGGETRIVGISVSGKREDMVKEVRGIAEVTARALKLGMPFSQEDIIVLDDYVGEGYGKLNKEAAEAIRTTALTEGVLLDPVYTGKAMAGLMALVKDGYFKKGEAVVFLHTGGTPALFPYREELREWIKN